MFCTFLLATTLIAGSEDSGDPFYLRDKAIQNFSWYERSCKGLKDGIKRFSNFSLSYSTYNFHCLAGVIAFFTTYCAYLFFNNNKEDIYQSLSQATVCDIHTGPLVIELIRYMDHLSNAAVCVLAGSFSKSRILSVICTLLSVHHEKTEGANPIWSKLTPTGGPPAARSGCAASPMGSTLFIFGGYTGAGPLNDLWQYNSGSNRWIPISPTGGTPPARLGTAGTTIGTTFYIFGGYNGITLFNDLWQYSTNTNAWTQLNPVGGPPAGRVSHTLSSIGTSLYLFGGNIGYPLNDLWQYHGINNSWILLNPIGNLPSARLGHSASVIGESIYIFGGGSNDLWQYNSINNKWINLFPLGDLPASRTGQTTIATGTSLYLFGGANGAVLYNDLWQYNNVSNTWTQLTPKGILPTARTELFSSMMGSLYVGGGGSTSGFLNDLWLLTIPTSTSTPTNTLTGTDTRSPTSTIISTPTLTHTSTQSPTITPLPAPVLAPPPNVLSPFSVTPTPPLIEIPLSIPLSTATIVGASVGTAAAGAVVVGTGVVGAKAIITQHIKSNGRKYKWLKHLKNIKYIKNTWDKRTQYTEDMTSFIYDYPSIRPLNIPSDKGYILQIERAHDMEYPVYGNLPDVLEYVAALNAIRIKPGTELTEEDLGTWVVQINNALGYTREQFHWHILQNSIHEEGEEEEEEETRISISISDEYPTYV